LTNDALTVEHCCFKHMLQYSPFATTMWSYYSSVATIPRWWFSIVQD